ncbi:UDP-N-acetylmuramoyl-tripeptide--D-alanyl-D-alanine ligase [Psychroserpens sp. XS_ASV72]|uniref:UDP-N-acetylmuramoyl-tripeptide--D-alanyl-D- alanine ligase n=1 Tax=Psychroserpens sp. XS_ASV72 TaxID=3241293 RepID=UPI0035148D96
MSIESIYEAFLNSSGVCTDTRKISNNCIFFALKGDNFNGNKFASEALKKGATFAVIDEERFNEGQQYILVDDVLKTLQNLATYHRKALKTPIISLTGSNGKTTTKELINSVLSTTYKTIATKGNLNNHIGVPLTLLNLTSDTEIGVVEMGANHQREIAFLCDIAYPDYGLITNFGKAHLEGFGSMEGIVKGKSELYDHLKKHEKVIFVNENDKKQVEQVGNYSNSISFGTDTTLLEAQPFVKLKFNGEIIQTQLTGAYNYNNIIAAIAIGLQFKVSEKDIISAIENYVPTNNRSQIIEKNSNKIFLDAYNANPTSMVAALDNFGGISATNKIAILGDMFELGNVAKKEHQHIADYAQTLNIDNVYLVGANFYNTFIPNNKYVKKFKTFEDLKDHLSTFSFKDNTLLIKGSRGMALERVLDYI